MPRALTPSESGHDKWLQLEVKYQDYFNLSPKWSFGLESDIIVSTHHLLGDYNAAMVNAASFNPTPASYNMLNPDMRANSFITAGLVPVYKFNDRLTARLALHGFMPMRPIRQDTDGTACYGRWFSRASLYSELSASLKAPLRQPHRLRQLPDNARQPLEHRHIVRLLHPRPAHDAHLNLEF